MLDESKFKLVLIGLLDLRHYFVGVSLIGSSVAELNFHKILTFSVSMNGLLGCWSLRFLCSLLGDTLRPSFFGALGSLRDLFINLNNLSCCGLTLPRGLLCLRILLRNLALFQVGLHYVELGEGILDPFDIRCAILDLFDAQIKF